MIKLADFGLSRRLNEISNSNKNIYGMVPYIDPQHFKNQRASKKSDVYSVGVLLWEISSGRLPFANVKPAILMKEISCGMREIPIFDTPSDYIKIYKSILVFLSLYLFVLIKFTKFFFLITENIF